VDDSDGDTYDYYLNDEEMEALAKL
jgi:hypothetical protein